MALIVDGQERRTISVKGTEFIEKSGGGGKSILEPLYLGKFEPKAGGTTSVTIPEVRAGTGTILIQFGLEQYYGTTYPVTANLAVVTNSEYSFGATKSTLSKSFAIDQMKAGIKLRPTDIVTEVAGNPVSDDSASMNIQLTQAPAIVFRLAANAPGNSEFGNFGTSNALRLYVHGIFSVIG